MDPRRIRFVFSKNRRGFPFKGELIIPSTSCCARTRLSRSSVIEGLFVDSSGIGPHDQVLRNQSVGNKCNVAFSGPRFAIVRRIRMSSSEAFAYSAKTSK